MRIPVHEILLFVGLLAAFGSAAAPVATELVKQHWMPKWAKTGIGLVIAAAGGVATVAIAPTDLANWPAVAATAWAVWQASQIAYDKFWSNLKTFRALGAATGSVPPAGSNLTPVTHEPASETWARPTLADDEPGPPEDDDTDTPVK